jgi:hypothetical protein
MTEFANEAALHVDSTVEAASIDSPTGRSPERNAALIFPRAVYFVLGAILILAAAMKTWQAASRPSPDVLLFGSKGWTLLMVEWEVLLGLWLVFTRRPSIVWWFATATFGVFASAALTKWVLGHESCGCFGRVDVPPWATFILDVMAVSALVLARRGRGRPEVGIERFHIARQGRGLTRRPIVFLCSVLLAGVPIAATKVGSAAPGGIDAKPGELVLLEPETWIGQPAPILEHIEIDAPLHQGQWRLLLYHTGCSKCQEVLPIFISAARNATIVSGIARFAIVDVEPHSHPDQSIAAGDCASGRLNDRFDWFVTTPVEITMTAGVVTGVRQEFDEHLAFGG